MSGLSQNSSNLPSGDRNMVRPRPSSKSVRFNIVEQPQVYYYNQTEHSKPAQYARRVSTRSGGLSLSFLKVLLIYLEKVDPTLARQAKQTAKLCCLNKSLGASEVMSLSGVLKRELRTLVGQHYWKRAQYYYHLACIEHESPQSSKP